MRGTELYAVRDFNRFNQGTHSTLPASKTMPDPVFHPVQHLVTPPVLHPVIHQPAAIHRPVATNAASLDPVLDQIIASSRPWQQTSTPCNSAQTRISGTKPIVPQPVHDIHHSRLSEPQTHKKKLKEPEKYAGSANGMKWPHYLSLFEEVAA